jgi:hypothetical protein
MATDNLSWCVYQFLTEHPRWREQSECCARRCGTEEAFLSISALIEFTKGSRRKRFLTGRDGQRALTVLRELEHIADHPRRPANDDSV